MKILCIITGGIKNDGITNSVLSYYENMDKTDIQIDLLTVKKIAKDVVDKVGNSGCGLVHSDFRKNTLSYVFKTAKLIRENNYDVVHVHGSSALLSIDLLAAFIGGCRIRIAHSRNTKCDHSLADKILRPVLYLLCTDMFACGIDAGKWLFGNREFTVVHNGKNLNKFKYNALIGDNLRNDYGWKNKILIGHVGNFNYQKNHEFLIEVFSKMLKENSKYHLVLIGTGDDYYNKAVDQVKKLGIEEFVTFTGSVSNIEEFLQAMDLMLFPSHFEGLPNVVIEWQAAGLPSIISKEITNECIVTSLSTQLPIDMGTDLWVKKAIEFNLTADRKIESEFACEMLKKNDFEITENAKKLKVLYFELLNNQI